MSLTDHAEHLAGHVEPHVHGKAGAGLFSRRIGPLSAGAWLGVIVGGVFLGLAYKKHAGLSGGPVAPAATDPAGGTPADPGGISSPGVAAGSQPATQGGQAPAGGAGPAGGYATNAEWERAAIRALMASGIRAGLAQASVVHFLSGDTLTAEQGKTVELAFGLVGPPPDGAPALTVDPSPTAAPAPIISPTSTPPAPASRPVAGRPSAHGRPTMTATPSHPAHPATSVTVRSGDTLIGLAHGGDWHALYQANAQAIEDTARAHGRRSSDGGHWIYPGTVLRLP